MQEQSFKLQKKLDETE